MESLGDVGLIDILPEDTRYLLDIRDWQKILAEFRRSDYSNLTEEERMKTWWEAIHGEEIFDELASELRLFQRSLSFILTVVKLGQQKSCSSAFL